MITEICLGMEGASASNQNFFTFDIVGVGYADVDRTNRRARFIIVKPDAFRTELGIDDIDRITLANRVVRAFRFACSAIDAITGDHR